MSNSKINFNSEHLGHERFLCSNVMMIGALAWSGYLWKSRGAIVVYGLKATESSLEESLDIAIIYLSKEELAYSYPDGIELFEFIDEYDPYNGMVVTFADSEKTLVDSYQLTLVLSPAECYSLLRPRMSEFEIYERGESTL
jgi:hypothetical protein